MDKLQEFPLMYNGWIIKKHEGYATIDKPDLNITIPLKFKNWDLNITFQLKFKDWNFCKKFIDNLRDDI